MVDWRSDFENILVKEFRRRQLKNARYSQRAFAKVLGISIGGLSQLLSGKSQWKISESKAIEAMEAIGLPSATKNRLITRMGRAPNLEGQEPLESEKVLTNLKTQAVLFGLDVAPNIGGLESLRKRVGLTLEEFSEALRVLLKLGLIEKKGRGQFRRRTGVLAPSGLVSREAIRQFHRASLLAAEQAITGVPTEQREFAGLTVVGSQKTLELIRQEIAEFQKRVIHLVADAQDSDQVFRISLSAIPVLGPLPQEK